MAEYYVSKRKLCASFEKNAAQFDSVEDAEYAAWLLGTCPCEDVAEVKHGTWELEEYALFWDSPDQRLRCTICGFTHPYDEWFEYCPNCGAKMDGKDKDNGEI